jgi:hypothetical protein
VRPAVDVQAGRSHQDAAVIATRSRAPEMEVESGRVAESARWDRLDVAGNYATLPARSSSEARAFAAKATLPFRS